MRWACSTRREHSRKELTRKLTSRGMDAAEVDAAVAEAGPRRLAERCPLCRKPGPRLAFPGGYGPMRIRAELATHGLDREAIATALDSFHGDWAEIASDLVRRRYGPVAALDLSHRRKAADFLIRRGFDSSSIRGAIRSELAVSTLPALPVDALGPDCADRACLLG